MTGSDTLYDRDAWSKAAENTDWDNITEGTLCEDGPAGFLAQATRIDGFERDSLTAAVIGAPWAEWSGRMFLDWLEESGVEEHESIGEMLGLWLSDNGREDILPEWFTEEGLDAMTSLMLEDDEIAVDSRKHGFADQNVVFVFHRPKDTPSSR